MPDPNAFIGCPRIVSIVLLVCTSLVVSAAAQHGGGGGGHGGGFGGHSSGHSGGGHSSGGHSHSSPVSSGHPTGHFWNRVHFGSHGRKSGGVASEGTTSFGSHSVRLGAGPAHPMPPTFIRTLPLPSMRHLGEPRFTTFSPIRHRREFFHDGFRRFHSSGCFFNGFVQVCSFEPTWPFYQCFSSFWFPFDFEIGDEDGGGSEMSASTDFSMLTAAPDSEMQTATAPESKSAPPLRGLDLDPRYFLLILKNGTEHIVTGYWLSDGYIEYVGRDGARSHIPVDALDLQETVRSNSARGLSFVVRSAP